MRHVTPHEIGGTFAGFGALDIGWIFVHVNIVHHQELTSGVLFGERFHKGDQLGGSAIILHGGYIVINLIVAQRAAKVGIPGKKQDVEQSRN